MGSIGITVLAVLLFTFFPSSPEVTFIFATGIAFVILLLVALSLLGREEEEEFPIPEEEKEELVSKLKEALEEERKAEPEKVTVERPRPDLLSWLREVSFEGWKIVKEGEVKEETLLGNRGRGKGFFRIWEGEKGRRLALYTLLFPSPEEARDFLQEILAKLGDWLYESHPGRSHFYLEKEGIDGAVWKKEEVVVLLLLGEAKKEETSIFLTSLPETLKPT